MSDPFAPAATRRRDATVVLVGVLGAAAPLALWLSGSARLGPALIATAVVVAASLAAYLARPRPKRPPPVAQPAPAPPPARAPAPPFEAILERLGDPVLLVAGAERTNPSDRRFLFANAAARDLLRIQFRRSERTRADFLANASHELRTPLASLAGFIETLRGHARDDIAARDKFLAIMHAQAERMRRLIDDLMSLSRIELGEHIPPSGEVDVALAVIDVMDALSPLATERCVAFDLALPPQGEAMVVGDRDQIVQVVQNLAENALKYTPHGGSVRVQVEHGLDAVTAAAPTRVFAAHLSLLTPDRALGRRYVMLRVADTGPGIARGYLPRLTERFYRVEGQKSGEHAGTGLGLAIVKHIINRHRGGLAVESAEGQGAAFTAYIPMTT